MPPELTCVDPASGKSDGLGQLKGGMVFDVSLGMARRMLAPRSELAVLEGLGGKVGFEVAVGRNGVVHVDAGSVKMTLAIGRAVQRVDREALGEEAQRKLVGEILKGV
jgi:exosome complex component RRP40